MQNRFASLLLLAAALTLSACGGGGGGGYSPPTNPGGGNNGPTALPAQTIGLSLPTGFIGVEMDPTFGQVAGFTQTIYSQTLAFQTGTNVTIENLGSNTHTLNVLSTTGFPASGPASPTGSGTTTIASGYASGPIAPGATVTATLGAAGTYFIGCAFHYLPAPQMRSALLVSAAANPLPGPQATPGPSGSGGGGSGSGCHGVYC